MPGVNAGLLESLMAAFSPSRAARSACPRGRKRGNSRAVGAPSSPEMARLAGDTGAKHLIGEHRRPRLRGRDGGEAASPISTRRRRGRLARAEPGMSFNVAAVPAVSPILSRDQSTAAVHYLDNGARRRRPIGARCGAGYETTGRANVLRACIAWPNGRPRPTRMPGSRWRRSRRGTAGSLFTGGCTAAINLVAYSTARC